ncbi:MAG: chromosome segregation ATPase [Cyanobacteria bacterium P01_A01_bin.135]
MPDGRNTPTLPEASSPRRLPGLGLLRSRLLWMAVGSGLFVGAGALAVTSLLRIPGQPNCPSIFWPMASATLRLYCADVAAEKNTERDLRRAIALVSGLPKDHPMRGEIDRMVEEWSFGLLDLAKSAFHQGDLEQALAIAKRISPQWPAHQEVEGNTTAWRTVWADAERLFQEAESALRQEQFKLAFSIALDLAEVGNRHWETAKYDQLDRLIKVTRQDGDKLSEARYLADQNSLTDLLKAIDLVAEIGETSYLHDAARRTSDRFWQRALDLGLDALNSGDSQQALAVARRLPDTAEFKAQAEDLKALALAVLQANKNTVADVEAAILQVKKVRPGRPLYYRAEQLIRYWQLDIQNLQYLSEAQSIAAGGGPDNLRAAIAKAELVVNSDPRNSDAQSAISQWRSEIQRIEDRPLLNEAEATAGQGDVRSLEAAITKAERIAPDSVLYGEATSAIERWTRQVQRISGTPVLEEARLLAQNGSYSEAIALVEELGPNHALYDQAQDQLEQWQQQNEGDTLLEQARNLSDTGTPANLADAIQLTRRVPRSSQSWRDANRLGNQWSRELFSLAQQTAATDLGQAIGIAQLIPPDTAAYEVAQAAIAAWQRE